MLVLTVGSAFEASNSLSGSNDGRSRVKLRGRGMVVFLCQSMQEGYAAMADSLLEFVPCKHIQEILRILKKVGNIEP